MTFSGAAIPDYITGIQQQEKVFEFYAASESFEGSTPVYLGSHEAS